MFEVILLFVLVLHTFREHYITNSFMIAFVGLLFLIFIWGILQNQTSGKNYFNLRSLIIFLIAVLVIGFITVRNFQGRLRGYQVLMIHDGLLQTELASKS